MKKLLLPIITLLLLSSCEKTPDLEHKVRKINGEEVFYNAENRVIGFGKHKYSELIIKRNSHAEKNTLLYVMENVARHDYVYLKNGEIDKITYQAVYTEPSMYTAFFKWANANISSIEGDQRAVSRNTYLTSKLKFSENEYALGNVDITLLLAMQEYSVANGPGLINVFDNNIGKRNKKLLSELTQTEPDAKYDATTKFRYVFDSEGRVKEVYATTKYVNEAQAKEEVLCYAFEY